MDARAAARAAHDADQIFGLENAEGFAQGRPRNAERRHQSPLGRQRIPLGQLPANDLGSDLVGDQFRRLRYPDARSPIVYLQIPAPARLCFKHVSLLLPLGLSTQPSNLGAFSSLHAPKFSPSLSDTFQFRPRPQPDESPSRP